MQFEEREIQLMERFQQLVIENLPDNNLTNYWLAAQLKISKRSLYRLVRKHTEQSPNEYTRSARLAKAYELLASGEFTTVKEVVGKVGFIKTAYFSRIFMAEFGVKPSDI